MLVILEGPDGGGKSTLAAELAERYGASVVHHGPYPGESGDELFERYLRSLLLDGPVVLDRSWLSEEPYALHVRDEEPRLREWHERLLERVALARGALVVNCCPSVATPCLEAYRSRRSEEYANREAQVLEVWRSYATHAAYVHGELPVLRYDYRYHGPERAAGVVDFLTDQRRYRPYLGTGLLCPEEPRALLVGHRANDSLGAEFDLPFVGTSGCSPWLAERLEHAEVPEASLAWWNVERPDGTSRLGTELSRVLETVGSVPVFALGQVASAYLHEYGVSHRRVAHPQHRKRFHHHEPYDLIDQLKEVTP